MIASHTVVVASNHRFDDPDDLIWNQGYENRGITIGSGVWISACCVIVDGVTIGDGAVAATGSVITKDVPPLAVVAGIPAQVMRYRGQPGQPKRTRAIRR